MEKTDLEEWLRSLMLALRRGPVIYPFLYAVFPIGFLWAHNVEELTLFAEPLEILVPLAIAVGFTFVALVSVGFILRDTRKAGLLVLLVLLAFYSFGSVYTGLQNAGIGDSSKPLYFLLAWACGTALVGLFILRIRAGLRGFTNYLNVTAAVLVIIPLVNVGAYTLGLVKNVPDHWASGAIQADASYTGPLPDIYYIVPDSYASSEILRDLDYDNVDFTDYLTRKGFFVANDSRSNYLYTETSLASSLNMLYLTDIDGAMPGDTHASFLYRDMINDGRVISTLRSLGYTIINTRGRWLERGSGHTSINCAGSSSARLQANDFGGALLSSTALYPVLRYFNVAERQIWNERLCDFSLIFDVKDISGPKFVYSHLSVPHPPYIFDRDGVRDPFSLSDTDFLNPEEYIDQVVFVNKKLQEVVQALLSGKGNPPIIIIQADHGTRVGEPSPDPELYRVRFGILNAYHLPNGGNDLLYESISPVNTFRVIFNHYFGTEYAILDDKNYFTDRPFSSSTYIDVTDLINQ